MPPLLKTYDAELLELVIGHPDQLALADTVAALLADLRTCGTPQDYHEFQGALLHELWDIETRRAAVSRVVKRLRRGDSIPGDAPELVGLPIDDSADRWQLENTVLERLARQLRTVGDALAWRAFGYDRRAIIALSRNAPSGPIAGKSGLDAELGAIMERWDKARHFTLLHDITSCIRIGDLTEFAADGTHTLWEIKTSPGRGVAAQTTRMKAAVDAINLGGALPDGQHLVAVDTPLRTSLKSLGDAITLARARGVHALRVPPGRVVVAAAPIDALRLGGDGPAWVARTNAERAKVLRRARIDGATHHYVLRTGDRAARTPAAAPYGIYPIDPGHCAGLICDLIHVEVTFDPETLARAATERGMGSEVLLPESHGELETEASVVRLWRGDHAIVLHPPALDQLLVEFITTDCMVAALDEVLRRPDAPTSPLLMFADEHKTWR